mmetsp:Transcript_7331/g.14996  ORF Transcript_7331/g.14996 Transcript_7331/m.14996 type:complete len:104 (+) Transcript_7331:226-537(+)
MASTEKNFYAQLEHLQSRYVGTGHPDISRREWMANMNRDSLACYLGHADMVTFFAVAEGSSVVRARFSLVESVARPVADLDEVKRAREQDDREDDRGGKRLAA